MECVCKNNFICIIGFLLRDLHPQLRERMLRTGTDGGTVVTTGPHSGDRAYLLTSSPWPFPQNKSLSFSCYSLKFGKSGFLFAFWWEPKENQKLLY